MPNASKCQFRCGSRSHSCFQAQLENASFDFVLSSLFQYYEQQNRPRISENWTKAKYNPEQLQLNFPPPTILMIRQPLYSLTFDLTVNLFFHYTIFRQGEMRSHLSLLLKKVYLTIAFVVSCIFERSTPDLNCYQHTRALSFPIETLLLLFFLIFARISRDRGEEMPIATYFLTKP